MVVWCCNGQKMERMTISTKLILDRDGDPTVDIECEWNHCEGVAGSLAIFAYWHLERITARDADSGRIVELEPHEIEWIARQLEPKTQ
jgi:hypothetical protein